MGHDFASLSPADFEDLCRDLIGRDLAIRFEAFAPGPDGGMDGRHAQGGLNTVLQVKHLVGSTFAKLKSTMKRERSSIDALVPNRYILATSRPLTPANKKALAGEIGPALLTQGDIYGAGDLNALLRKYPDIERAHVKLWLSSAAVLDRVLHSAARTVTAITRKEIETKVRVYALNPSFTEAQLILEKQHVLIVSGPPGVGKTTLAEMLAYTYLAEGWELVAVRSLEDGFGSIIDSKRQIFLFDDFLGRTSLDTRALASRDSDLARFIRWVRGSPNARFILTTRAPVFEEARRASEHLADPVLNISRYLLDVGVYTRRIRSLILYNHLVAANTPYEHVETLIENGTVQRIIDHKNYNPRVIEWMTDGNRLTDVTPEAYPQTFVDALDNPAQLWEAAYRHLPEKCRHLLIVMFFCSEYGVELDELRTAYEALHRQLCINYGIARDPKDFEESIRILEGGFITLRGTSALYVNPSFRDYLATYIRDIELLCHCAISAQRARLAQKVWDAAFAGPWALSPGHLKRLAHAFSSIAEQFTHLPTWKKTGPNAYQTDDLGNADRIALLLHWWAETKSERYAELALAVATDPPAPRYWPGFSAWREGSDLVDLVGKLRDGDYYPDFPFAEPLINELEASIIGLLRGPLAYDELETLVEAVENASPPASERLKDAALNAIRREIDEVEISIESVDSESALEEHGKTLAKLAPRAGVEPALLAIALQKVKDRVNRLAEETDVGDAPAVIPKQQEREIFTDAAIKSLFASLLSHV